MRYLKLLWGWCFLSGILWAQTDYELWKKEQNLKNSKEKKVLEQYTKSQNTEFGNYRKKYDYHSFIMAQTEDFGNYKSEITALWKNFVESSPKNWVVYAPDFKARSQVDFEKGQITLEAICPQEQFAEVSEDILSEQLKVIINQKDVFDKPVLENQIIIPGEPNKCLSPQNVEQVANVLAATANISPQKTPSGENVLKTTVTLKLLPDHLKLRAEKYLPLVKQHCYNFDINPTIVMGIIEQESAFNPLAYNPQGNAFGLMQIVPKHAGLTMNRLLHNKNTLPTAEELYLPETNLAFGVGYLRHLQDAYFKEIVNSTSLELCLIAAYNGGAGSVYSVFDCDIKKSDPSEKKKMLSSLTGSGEQELLKKLSRGMPKKESRKYVVSVWNNSKNYQDFH